MAFFNPNNDQNTAALQQQSSPIDLPRIEMNSVMRLVYVWLGLGMLMTMATAWIVGNTPALLEFSVSSPFLLIILLFGSLIGLSVAVGNRNTSPGLAAGLFFLFTAIEGFVLAGLMVAYLSPTLTMPDGTTIINEFYNPTPVYAAAATAAALFGSMSLIGYTTRMDLTKMGTYFVMGLIGLVIAMLVNAFLLQSDGLSLVISIGGVILFTGLTAYDTQRIKEMSMSPHIVDSQNAAVKLSIYGALNLYLDLLNLFLFLLSIFGRD